MWWSPGVANDEWQVTNLSLLVGRGENPIGSVSVASATWGDTDIFYTTKNDDVVRIYWDSDTDVWDFSNLVSPNSATMTHSAAFPLSC